MKEQVEQGRIKDLADQQKLRPGACRKGPIMGCEQKALIWKHRAPRLMGERGPAGLGDGLKV